jgi:hypothetical protein
MTNLNFPHHQKADIVAHLILKSPKRARELADRLLREGFPLGIINYCSSSVMYDLRRDDPSKAEWIAQYFGCPYSWDGWLPKRNTQLTLKNKETIHNYGK